MKHCNNEHSSHYVAQRNFVISINKLWIEARYKLWWMGAVSGELEIFHPLQSENLSIYLLNTNKF